MNMDLSTVQIETERLRLVPTTRVYAEDIFSEYTDAVTKYMNYPPPNDFAVFAERVEQRENDLKAGKLLHVTVLSKDSDEFLGCFAVEDLDQPTPEMGGWFKESAQGKGYGKETVAALKQWADEYLEYEYLVWPAAKENVSSCKLAESLGGRIGREYEKTNHTGAHWEYVEYRIFRNANN